MGKAMPENDAFAWVRFCLRSQLRSERCLMSLRLLNFHCFVKYRLRTRKCQEGNVFINHPYSLTSTQHGRDKLNRLCQYQRTCGGALNSLGG